MVTRAVQELEQPAGIRVIAIGGDQGVEPTTQARNAAAVLLGREVRPFSRADAVADEAPQLLGDGVPLTVVGARRRTASGGAGRRAATGGALLVDLPQFAQQVHEALLPIGHVDQLVRAPEVVQQDAVEGLAEHLGERC